MRTTTLLCVSLFLLATVPTVSADDPVKHTYAAPLGVLVDGSGGTAAPCPNGCDLDGDNEGDLPINNGPYRVEVPFGEDTMTVRADDAVFGANVPLQACTFDPDGKGLCHTSVDWTCSPLTLTDLEPGSEILVWIATALVTDDEACGATAGTLTFESG